MSKVPYAGRPKRKRNNRTWEPTMARAFFDQVAWGDDFPASIRSFWHAADKKADTSFARWLDAIELADLDDPEPLVALLLKELGPSPKVQLLCDLLSRKCRSARPGPAPMPAYERDEELAYLELGKQSYRLH